MDVQTEAGPLRGAKKVVSTCPGLLPGQNLLIITDNPQLFQRELIDSAGRILQIPVGDDMTARLAAKVYSTTPNRDTAPLNQLAANTGLDGANLLKILRVMQERETVRLHGLPT